MKNILTAVTRMGRIQYLNAIPFYHRLHELSGAELQYYQHYPTKINLAMRRKKIDVAPISSLEYLHHQKDYLLLPDLAIGSRDFSGSVLLLSREKIEGLDGGTIALSRESLSSAVLMRILLKFKYKFKNRFVITSLDPAGILDKFQAGLVIGDAALMFRPKSFVYKYDLSELWWNWTEKPFCFAVWAVQRQFARDNPAELSKLCEGLSQNRDRNLADIETLIKETLRMDFLHPDFAKFFGYLFNLNYHLDLAMQEGLELFYRLAHRLGFSPKPDELEFFKYPKKMISK